MTTTAMTMRELEALFRSDATALGAEREVEEVFAELRAAYEDPSRKYHSIEHIAECLALLADERASLTAPSEVAMAICERLEARARQNLDRALTELNDADA